MLRIKHKPGLAFFFALVWSCPAILISQPANVKVFTLDQCIELALKNNENLRTAALNIEHEQQNKKNATEVPKTNVVYTQGQFNSIYKHDEIISIGQTIPFPTVFSERHALAAAQVKSSEYHYNATKRELIYGVKVNYYSLLHLKAVQKLLHQEDSIFTEFSSQVKRKHAQGKTTLLEQTAAETERMDVENKLFGIDEDIQNAYLELSILMNISGGFDIQYFDIRRNYLAIQLDTSALLSHPILRHFEQQVEVQRHNVSLERAKILPDLSFSYFNQTIYGLANVLGDEYFLTKKNRLQGFTVGVSLPLWIFPQRSRVEAARLNMRQAQSDFNYHSTLMRGQYAQAIHQYLKYRKSLNFYHSNAGNNSKLVEDATTSYNKGEISYGDYMQIVGHVLTIENNYLNVINQANLSALKIEYLLSK